MASLLRRTALALAVAIGTGAGFFAIPQLTLARTHHATASVRVDRHARKINLNTASTAQLRTLPGIGELLAQRIVAGRPYKSVDDLKKVKGLGPKKIDAIRNRVTI